MTNPDPELKPCHYCGGKGETMPTHGDYLTPDKCFFCNGTGNTRTNHNQKEKTMSKEEYLELGFILGMLAGAGLVSIIDVLLK